MVACPLRVMKGRKLEDEFNLLLSKGFARVLINGEVKFIEGILNPSPQQLVADTPLPRAKGKSAKKKTSPLLGRGDGSEVEILIDRAAVNAQDEDLTFRLSDSVQTAFFEGHGDCLIYVEGEKKVSFSDRVELDGITFTEPSINLFSFNNPFGACQTCEGFGKI